MQQITRITSFFIFIVALIWAYLSPGWKPILGISISVIMVLITANKSGEFPLKYLTHVIMLSSGAWLIYSPGFEPVISFSSSMIAYLELVKREKHGQRHKSTTPSILAKSRKSLLRFIQSNWVDGFLFETLKNSPQLDIQFEVIHEEDPIYWEGDLAVDSKVFFGQEDLFQVFQNLNESLLILGSPGSGKTISLIKIAKEALLKAQKDQSSLIPIILNLSSWGEKNKELQINEWISIELKKIYRIPQNVATTWINDGDCLLLLDGLDEVDSNHQSACIRELNSFMREHTLISVVICSRSNDYSNLKQRLHVSGIVQIIPLTQEQIFQYLSSSNLDLLAAQKTLELDETLLEVVKSPLFLRTMTIAYKGLSVHELQKFSSLENRRKHILDQYIKQMLVRRKLSDDQYTESHVIRSLSWLASRLQRYNVSWFSTKDITDFLVYTWKQLFIWAGITTVISIIFLGLVSVFSAPTYLPNYVILIFAVLVPLILGYMLTFLRAVFTTMQHEVLWSSKLDEGDTSGLTLAFFLFYTLGIHDSAFKILKRYYLVYFVSGLFASTVGNLFTSGNSLLSCIILILAGIVFYSKVESRNFLLKSSQILLVFTFAIGLSLIPVDLSGIVFWGFIIAYFPNGQEFIMHATKPIVTKFQPVFPITYKKYLTFLTNKILLRKVGNSYSFIHPLFLEYLSELWLEISPSEPELAGASEPMAFFWDKIYTRLRTKSEE